MEVGVSDSSRLYRCGDGAGDESCGSTARRQRQTAAGGGGGTRRTNADFWHDVFSVCGSFYIFILGFVTDCDDPFVDLEPNNDGLDVLWVSKRLFVVNFLVIYRGAHHRNV